MERENNGSSEESVTRVSSPRSARHFIPHRNTFPITTSLWEPSDIDRAFIKMGRDNALSDVSLITFWAKCIKYIPFYLEIG